MPIALGMKIQLKIKHLIAVLALAKIPVMLALCESICPSMPFLGGSPTMFVGSILTWAP
jgi:hypothetical protein